MILSAHASAALLVGSAAPCRGRSFGRHLSMTAADAALPSLAKLTDPREWLEDVEGDEALEWVRERNAHALNAIGEPATKPLYGRIRNILDSNEKIPYIGRVLNGLYYNFWQDDKNVQGIWRRCTLDEYKKPSPSWEIVLDLDALSEADGVSWVWGGSTLLNEGPEVRKDRVMISLSRGGADATIAREFDLDAKAFISPADGGFELPECKARVSARLFTQLCHQRRLLWLPPLSFGAASPLATHPQPLASRLSPLASRLSPLASRLSPFASRPLPLASRRCRSHASRTWTATPSLWAAPSERVR